LAYVVTLREIVQKVVEIVRADAGGGLPSVA